MESRISSSRLREIKKQLGFQREEVYTVFKYPGRKSLSANSFSFHQEKSIDIPSEMSNPPPIVAVKPTIPNKSRRPPPKPPRPNLKNDVGTSKPRLPPMRPPMPKAKANLSTSPLPVPKKPVDHSNIQTTPPNLTTKSESPDERTILANISRRPRLDTPNLDREEPQLRRPLSPVDLLTVTNNYRPQPYSVVDVIDTDDVNDKQDHDTEEPELYATTYETALVVGTDEPPGTQYSEVMQKGLKRPPDPSILPISGPINSQTDYNISTHSASERLKLNQPVTSRYSQLDHPNKTSSPSHKITPYYDEIDIDGDRKPQLVVQTFGYSTLDTSSTDTTEKDHIPSLDDSSSKPAKALKPPIPPRPSPEALKNRNSRGSSRGSSSPVPNSPTCLESTTNEKLKDSDSKSGNTFHETNKCVIDIDALIAQSQTRNNPDQENRIGENEGSDIHIATPNNGHSGSLPNSLDFQESMVMVLNSSPKLPRRAYHVYEPTPWEPEDSVLSNDTTVRSSTDQPKKPLNPPRRKAPPPPRGSPPFPRKEKPQDLDKSLTLGRSPRNLEMFTLIEKEDDNEWTGAEPFPSPKSKKMISPGIKSKFKRIFRGSSKEDFAPVGGSFRIRRKSEKLDHVISTPISVKMKSDTLPARPRGKSVDPYMEMGIYSLVGDDLEDEEGERKPDQSLLSDAVPYSIVDMRSGLKQRKGFEFRRSLSLEHLYDMAKLSDEQSPFVKEKSPLVSNDFSLESHIYASVTKHKKVVEQNDETEKEKEEIEQEEPDDKMDDYKEDDDESSVIIPHVTANDGSIYAVVNKDNILDEIKKQKEEALLSKTPEESDLLKQTQDSSPSHKVLQVVPSSKPKRTPPPKPSPYKPGAGSTVTVHTKASSKFPHLLTSSPPTHPPPVSPQAVTENGGIQVPTSPMLSTSAPQQLLLDNSVTRKIPQSHSYEMVDFEVPDTLPLSSPTTNFPIQRRKIRNLKPKDKPAPPPPRYGANSRSPLRISQLSPTHILDESTGPNSSQNSSRSLSPQFLFSDGRAVSFVGAGDVSPSISDSTLSSAVEINEDDSDVSTDWDPSSDEEDEEKGKKSAVKVEKSKTFYIVEEILNTERTFVKGLSLLDKDFRNHMLSANSAHEKHVVSEEVLKHILSNVGTLYNLNSKLLAELETRVANWDSLPKLGDIFVSKGPFLMLYSQYISNFDKALKTLDEQCKKNPLFNQVLKEFEIEPKCNNLTVAAYLLETVQRIPRYKLLLADYIKHLPEDSDDRVDSEKAYEIISSVASHVNETMRQIDNFKKTIEVSKKLIGDVGDSLLSPHRKLLKEGELIKSSRKEKQPRMFFLFTDLLIYASGIPPANTTFRVIKRIPLDGMRVQFLDDPEMKYGFQIISTCKSFRLDCTSVEERTQWLQAFDGAIKDHIQRLKSRQLNRRSVMIDLTDGEDGPLGSFAPPWLPDSSVSMCQLCGIRFTVTRRRHHCRGCGLIFCGECSSYVAPLAYKNNKLSRVCQTCYSTLTEGEEFPSDNTISNRSSLRRRPLRTSLKKVSMPSVLTEVKARDQSAQIGGYLFYRRDKSRQWKKKWFVVFNLVMYEFKKHEDVSAQQSIPLPSYEVTSPVSGLNDPLVFSLQHSGAGKLLFKAEDEDQLERWVEVLQKAVRGETIHV